MVELARGNLAEMGSFVKEGLNHISKLVGILFCCVVFGVSAQEQSASDAMAEKEARILGEINRSEQSVSGYDRIDTTQSAQGEQVKNESVLAVTARITLILAVIAAVLFGVAWTMRRLGLAGTSRPGGGAMEVLEGLPLGQNRSLVLARVLDKVYLLGVTAQQMVPLETYEGDKALEVISNTRGGMSITKFRDVFNSFMNKGSKPA